MGTADDTHSKLNLNHQIWCLCVWVCVSECVQLPEGRTVFSNSFLASVVSCRIKKYTIWLFSGTHHQIVTILLILSVGCVWACESVWNQDQRSADLVSVSPRWVTLSLVWKWLEGSVPAGHPCSYSLSPVILQRLLPTLTRSSFKGRSPSHPALQRRTVNICANQTVHRCVCVSRYWCGNFKWMTCQSRFAQRFVFCFLNQQGPPQALSDFLWHFNK